jgi:hypothetical protein
MSMTGTTAAPVYDARLSLARSADGGAGIDRRALDGGCALEWGLKRGDQGEA